jgi:hypothetical protein
LSEYVKIPGLLERIRIMGGYIQGETGWARVATDEEEAMFAALCNAQVTGGQHPEERGPEVKGDPR